MEYTQNLGQINRKLVFLDAKKMAIEFFSNEKGPATFGCGVFSF